MAEEENFSDDEDVVVSAPDERNWKGIIIAVLVIAFVLGMIVTAVILVSPPNDGQQIKGDRVSLMDILGGEFKINKFNGSWISDSEFAFFDSFGGISIFNANNLTSRLLISNYTLKHLNIDGFNVSADERFALLSRTIKQKHRHSSTSNYFIYNIQTKHYRELSNKPDERGHPGLIYAKWAPVGSGMVMVDTNYDIYYKESGHDFQVYRVTDTGQPGVIYNGAPDLIYEAEILGDQYASWFAPNGRMLAFAAFNDSTVDELPLVHYNRDYQYPIVSAIRYPKAGQKNPKVTLWVADMGDPRLPHLRDVKPPNVVKDQDHYFTAVTWVDENVISVVWMNRAQNISVISMCSPPKYYCQAIHTDKSNRGWVDLYKAPLFSNDGQSFLVRLPIQSGEAGEFAHVNLYRIRIEMMNLITHGPYEVTEIVAWDQDNNYIYYLGTAEDRPGERHLYRVSDISPANLRFPECLSCFEIENSTETCLYNKVHLSKVYSYFVLECLGPDVPRTYLFSSSTLQMLSILNNYDTLRKKVDSSALPEVKTFRVELEGDPNYIAQVQLLLPPARKVDNKFSYPMVVHAFGSPGSQSVNSLLRFDYGTYLASTRDIIYAFIDGRGTGFQGDRLKHEVYLSLGDKEVSDQLAVVAYLRDNLPFIDPKRIMIWGKDYGGYLATMALAKDAEELFKCGVAVAPITMWNHYDSIFTERYMGSPRVHPGSNYKGYEAADATKVAGNLINKKFLLVHGTADRNVHYHHSMILAKELTKEGVLFQQIVYPDEDHSLSGVQEHLYKSMDKFLSDCFRPSVEELYNHIKKKKDLEELGYL